MNALPLEWTYRTQIINEVIRYGAAVSYLEIGCGDGANHAAIRCRRKWSVDPAEGDYVTARPTHRMTSDAFFDANEKTFDVIFIDGLHHANQVERDLSNALAALEPGGVVICHDLNPATEDMPAVPRKQREWTGDGWKAWLRLRARFPDLAMIVVEADYGVGLILPGREPGPSIARFSEEDLTWENFNRKRREWLNLSSPQDARAFVLDRLGHGHSETNAYPEAERDAGPTALFFRRGPSQLETGHKKFKG